MTNVSAVFVEKSSRSTLQSFLRSARAQCLPQARSPSNRFLATCNLSQNRSYRRVFSYSGFVAKRLPATNSNHQTNAALHAFCNRVKGNCLGMASSNGAWKLPSGVSKLLRPTPAAAMLAKHRCGGCQRQPCGTSGYIDHIEKP